MRFLCVAMLVVAACSRPPPPPPPATPAPDIAMERVTLRNYRGSVLHLVAQSPHVEVLRSTMELWATDAGLSMPESGALFAAKSVNGNTQTQHLEGHGGVRLTTPDGIEAQSPEVTYERAAGTQGGAFSDAGVRISHPQFSLEADAFAVDFAEQHAEFTHPKTVTKATAR